MVGFFLYLSSLLFPLILLPLFHLFLFLLLPVGSTSSSAPSVPRCSALAEIDLRHCASMTEEACRLFIALNVHMPLTLVPDSEFLIRANNSFLPNRDEEALAS